MNKLKKATFNAFLSQDRKAFSLDLFFVEASFILCSARKPLDL
jgi:hypothetical protein